jgi:phosphomannomutase
LLPWRLEVLADNYWSDHRLTQTMIVGYDRRFMAEDFAQTAAESLQKARS